MHGYMTDQMLSAENRHHAGSGGTSGENRHLGFRPAFRDTQTDAIYPSRFADGQPAPCHLLDGLPGELVVARTPCGRVTAVKASVIAGFLRSGVFYTRDEAAALASAESSCAWAA
jgi:hypothetical protein